MMEKTCQSLHTQLYILPFQAWIYHCHLHPLQAANCCRNFRLVVDENDLEWVVNEKYILLILKQLHESVRSNTHRCRKFFRDAK